MIKTTNNIFFFLVCSFLLPTACKQTPEKKQVSLDMPANAVQIPVQITNLNCFKERKQFFVTGVCNNQTDQWQRIWLRMEPSKYAGDAIFLQGERGIVFPVFSTAVPPRGRSSFFQGWDMNRFAKVPDTCQVVCAGAIVPEAGPILMTEGMSAVRMVAPSEPGQETREQGWQISGTLSNPLDKTATRPCLEMLVFGKDQRLWFSTWIDLEDARQGSLMQLDSRGPLAPGAKRNFTTQINYGNLPMPLTMQKIGRVEVLAFEYR
jgi:hypothetical protein